MVAGEGSPELIPISERPITELVPFPADEPTLITLAGVVRGVAERQGADDCTILSVIAADFADFPNICAATRDEVLAIGEDQNGRAKSSAGARSGKPKGGRKRSGNPAKAAAQVKAAA